MSEGRARLWAWFSLSYASFLTLPRVLMHEMPDEWQDKMAALLDEFNETFPNAPGATTRVQAVDGRGKMTKFPRWLLNYRYPDRDEIAKARAPSPNPSSKET